MSHKMQRMNKQSVKEKLDHSPSILCHSCVKQRGEDTKHSKEIFPLTKVYLDVEISQMKKDKALIT